MARTAVLAAPPADPAAVACYAFVVRGAPWLVRHTTNGAREARVAVNTIGPSAATVGTVERDEAAALRFIAQTSGVALEVVQAAADAARVRPLF